MKISRRVGVMICAIVFVCAFVIIQTNQEEEELYRVKEYAAKARFLKEEYEKETSNAPNNYGERYRMSWLTTDEIENIVQQWWPYISH